MTDNLATYSLVLVYSAMAIYLIAFIAYALDLAKRASLTTSLVNEEVAAPVRVGVLASASGAAGSSGGVATAERAAVPVEAPRPKRKQTRFERVAYALTILGWLLQVGGDVTRGIAAGRVPWANLYEFALTASAIVVGVFIFVQIWQDLKFLGAYITGFVLLALGLATVNFYVAVAPLPPALQSYWLVIHVFVATLGTAFFAIAAGLSVVQLLQARRESNRMTTMKFMDTFPNATRLENMAYRVSIIGFVFWTFTLIAGAIWAEHAWGRYWGWDTKEVWTFIIWVIFAGYIHARATRGWRGSRSAWLAIIGFAAVVFNFTVVNVFFKGLHAYSGL